MKIRKIVGIFIAVMMIFASTFGSIPVKAETLIPEISFVGVEHSPLVEGDSESFYLVSKNYSGDVQYRVFLYTQSKNTWEDITNGYTDAVKSSEPYKIMPEKIFSAGKYKLSIWVKRADVKGVNMSKYGDYDSFYTAYLDCVSRDDASRVYVNGKMQVERNVYAAGESVVINGIDGISGMKAPYSYKLNYYNVEKNIWEKGVTGYGSSITWKPDKAGIYMLDVWVKSSDSKAKYEAWKFERIDIEDADVYKEDGKVYTSDADRAVIITGNNVIYKNARINGNLYIFGNNAALENVNVKGNIIVDPGKDGNADLNTVTAEKIDVRSGGQNSIHLNGVKAQCLSVNNSDGTSPVRIESSGDTVIDTTIVGTYAIIDSKSGSFGTIEVKKSVSGELIVEFRGTFEKTIKVTDEATIRSNGADIKNLELAPDKEGTTVTLDGSFNNVNITKPVNINTAKGTYINNFIVQKESTGSGITLEGFADVNNIQNMSSTSALSIQKTITVTGIIEAVDKNLIKFEDPDTTYKVDEKPIDEMTDTEKQEPPTIPTGGTSTVHVSAVTVFPATMDLTAGGVTGTIKAEVIPSNAANKNVTWLSSNTGIATVDNGVVTPISAGTAIITVKTADGSKTASCTVNVISQDIAAENVNIINQNTITFNSSAVDSIKVDDVVVAMSGTTAPYAEYSDGTYTVNLAEPLTVGSHTITMTKSGCPAETLTAGYFGKIERDPGNTGGNVTAVMNDKTITFSGEIAFYGADETLGRVQGHRVGVKITAPAGMTDVKGTATLTTGSTTYAAGTNWMDGDNYFYYYPLVTQAGQIFTLTVKWDGTDAAADVFTIKIDDNAALEGEIGEPNNDMDHATAITVNAEAKTQWIYPSTDEDWYKFDAQAGTLYKIQTSNLYPDYDDNMSYEVDTVIYIYDKDGNKLYENDDDASDPDYGVGSRIDFLCNESGTYYVKVVDYSNSDLDNETQENYVGRYDIAVTELTGVTAVPTIQEISFDNNNHVNVKGTSEAGARVFLTGNNGCFCNVLADDSGNWEFRGLSLYIGNIIDVTAIAENKSASAAATAVINDSAQEAVNEVAAGITMIAPPEKDATTLTLPGVPDGYTIAIKSSSNIGWVKADGTVTPQKYSCEVRLVLTVTNTSTGRWADTKEIAVIIPQSSVGDEIDKITSEALGTITVGDTQTVLQKAQALISDGYTVTVKAADGTFINASGVAIAAGNGSIIFTVTQDAGNINPADTNPIAITVNAASNKDQTAPEGLTGVAPTTAANNDGKITGTTTAMEYKLSSDSTYTACGEGETAGLATGTYDVRYAAKTGFNASAIAEVTVPSYTTPNQAAPTGLTGVAPTTFDGTDGKITGTTTAMEYKLASASDSTYISCGDGETTGLAVGTYSVRYAATDGSGAGNAANIIIPYNVASAGDLDNVRNNLNGNYIQTKDIDLSDYSNWNPIGTNNISPFSGSYNGNGYKISNLTASGSTYIGLFGYVSGQIKNVNLDNVSITATYNDNVGSYDIGGLAGCLVGTIKNSHITGCNISGYCDAGGLVGGNYGLVEECSASGTVTTSSGTGYKESVGGLVGRNNGTIQKSFAVADVSGDAYYTGGLVGNNGGGSIDKCYASGSVTTTKYDVGGLVGDNRKFNGADSIIRESYAVGIVSGGSSGGLVGLNDGGNNDAGTIETSYYDEDTTKQSDTGKGIPEPTAAMMQQATFTGWDFSNTWSINEGITYPFFK